MPIKITVGDPSKTGLISPEQQVPDESGHFPIKLRIRKMLNGNLLIGDHPDIDIVLDLINTKLITYPKEEQTEEVYDAQDRLMKFLSQKGIVEADTVQGGNIYGSIEAVFPSDEDKIQAVLFGLKKFLVSEEPYAEIKQELEDREVQRLTNPEDAETTEMGQVEHNPKRGTLRSVAPFEITGGAYFLNQEQKQRVGENLLKENLKKLGEKIGIDWNKISFAQFEKGFKVEKEHGKTVNNDEEIIAKIALDHLKEFPDYYDRLEKMEGKK